MQTFETKKQETSPHGFTLAELMIVIAIMALLMAVAIPATQSLFGGGKQEIAVNAISSAATMVNSYSALQPAFDIGSYSGTALIFDTANGVRLTENDPFAAIKQNANSHTDLLEQPTASRVALNGYSDIKRGGVKLSITIPTGAGVLGFIRDDSNKLKLIAPPFAVRFNQFGVLIAGTYTKAEDKQYAANTVIYDGDGDGKFEYRIRRSTSYKPSKWDPEHEDFVPNDAYPGGNQSEQIRLPFERLEAIIGVLIYNKEELPGDLNSEVTTSHEHYEWLMENGTQLFFNRYTGAIYKN